MKRKANIWQRQHKWIGLLLSPFIITFCLSGIALNHAEYLRHVNVNRALLPRAYRYNQWNNGLLRGTLRHQDHVLLYGNAGVWQTDTAGRHIADFNRGLPPGADHRNVRGIVATTDGSLFAAGQYALYRRERAAWREVALPKPPSERLSDITVKDDTLIATGRSHIYIASPPYSSFQQIQLRGADNGQGRVSLFRLVWLLHGGGLLGLAGKLTVDTLAAIMLFLSLSGLIHTLSPRKARPRRASARARARRGLMLWHNRLGWLLLIPLLLLTLTGWLLRPPGLIAIARVKVKPIPFSALDSDNPWHDKLRTLRHDDALGDWLLGTSDGFYSLRSLTGVPKPEDTQPPVSVMGVNAQQKDSAGRWIIGSFTGLYLWDRHSRHITDYFTGLEAKPITGKPVGQHAISGYSADFAPGGFPIDYVSGSNAIAMPGWMATLPMSLRNVCVEAHTGRIFTLLGKGSALYICVAGIAIAWCLWSGWKCHWPIRAKRKKR